MPQLNFSFVLLFLLSLLLLWYYGNSHTGTSVFLLCAWSFILRAFWRLSLSRAAPPSLVDNFVVKVNV